jgi:hypothetical protein
VDVAGVADTAVEVFPGFTVLTGVALTETVADLEFLYSFLVHEISPFLARRVWPDAIFT